MLTAINITDRLAQHENGQTVPLAFFKGNEAVEDWEEADSVVVGPWYEWNPDTKKFDKKYAKIERAALDLG